MYIIECLRFVWTFYISSKFYNNFNHFHDSGQHLALNYINRYNNTIIIIQRTCIMSIVLSKWYTTHYIANDPCIIAVSFLFFRKYIDINIYRIIITILIWYCQCGIGWTALCIASWYIDVNIFIAWHW